jgi:hypothetical protein
MQDRHAANTVERFTETEWKLLQSHGAKMGLAFGLIQCVVIGVLGAIAHFTGRAWLTQPGFTSWVLAATVPVCWAIGWLSNRRLPAELRAKSRRVNRRTWWIMPVLLAVFLGMSLLVIGRPAWVGWLVLAAIIVVALVASRLMKHAMVASPTASATPTRQTT